MAEFTGAQCRPVTDPHAFQAACRLCSGHLSAERYQSIDRVWFPGSVPAFRAIATTQALANVALDVHRRYKHQNVHA